MVVSQIDKSIEYPPVKFVDSEDLDYDAQLYAIELFPDMETIIALGKVKYTFIDKNVLYIPVYLTKDSEVLLQIGIYEFPANIYTSLLDEDNDFDISLLENPLPLLYKFTNESFVRRELGQKKKKAHSASKEESESSELELQETSKEKESKKPKSKEEESKKPKSKEEGSRKPKSKEEESSDAIQLSKDSRVPNQQTILEEIFEEDDDEKPIISDEVAAEEIDQENKFKEHAGHNWLEKYMKNENYGIIDNEAGGDCLFATIRDAYSGIGKNIDVADLRNIASDAATETTFQNFKEQYDMYATEVTTLGAQLSILQTQNKALKQQYRQTKDRDAKAQLVAKSKPLIAKFKQAKKEKKAASELLHEYRWMRGVDTLEKLKKKMRTCGFWAESWTLQTLEQALNVKLIILSSFNYMYKDYDNILSCGDMAPNAMVSKGMFKPKYYIILDYTGNHYKLVTYKQKRIFEFNDIPVKIKKLIIDKCMESKGKSIYNYIPKFKLLQISMKDSPTSSLSPGDDAGPEDQGDPSKEPVDEGADLSTKPTFDETTVFQFYSKSADKPLPGKGAGEIIEPRNIKKIRRFGCYKGMEESVV